MPSNMNETNLAFDFLFAFSCQHSNMAPTICKDEHNVSNERRTRNGITKHRNSSVISYGKHSIRNHMFLTRRGSFWYNGSHAEAVDGNKSVTKHVRSVCRVQAGQCAMALTHVSSTHSYHLYFASRVAGLRDILYTCLKF